MRRASPSIARSAVEASTRRSRWRFSADSRRRRRQQRRLLAPFEKLQPVLELRDAELELLELGAQDEPELAQHAVHPGAGPLRRARRVAAPPAREVVDRAPRLVTAHAAALGERLRELLDAFGGQRHRAERGEEELLDPVAVVVTWRGPGGVSACADVAARASRRPCPPRAGLRRPGTGPAPPRRLRLPRPPRRPLRRPVLPCRRPCVARNRAHVPSRS